MSKSRSTGSSPNRILRSAMSRLRSSERGQSVVELALILPVLLLLLASAIDLGRLYYSQITVNDAAREGALEAAHNPGSFLANTPCTTANKATNRIMCRTLNEAKGGFITVAPADVTVTCSTGTCPPVAPVLGDTVSVRVVGHFSLLTPLLANFFGGQSITFSSTAGAQLAVTPANAAPGAPVANFTMTPSSGTAPLTVTFADTSTGSPTSWAWTFGDGQTSTAQNPPSHVYPSGGTYTITLTATNAGGSNTATKQITITSALPAPPVAAFTVNPTSGAAPLSATVADTSTGSPTSWLWNFGDGQTSNVQAPPAHSYAGVGTYTITLTVTNAGGSNSTTHTVSTTGSCVAPVASFTLNITSGKKKQASFVVTDTSTNMATAGCNNTWSWNFGDGSGNSSLQAPPGHVYQSAGTYTITLGASNSAGSSTATQVVTATP